MTARLKLSHDEIKQLLALLHYKNIDNDIWKKRYNKYNCMIKVDFSSETILYPEPFELGDRTTSNFVNSENFVVLECVDRLLRKGYRAMPESSAWGEITRLPGCQTALSQSRL